MVLEIDDAEVVALAQAMFIAGWICESSDNPEKQAIATLQQKIFQAIHQGGCPDLVEFDSDSRTWFAPADREEEWVEDFVAPHDDEHLWESLQLELARRDLWRELGDRGLEALDEPERSRRMQAALEVYTKEFSTWGLERLVLDPGAGL